MERAKILHVCKKSIPGSRGLPPRLDMSVHLHVTPGLSWMLKAVEVTLSFILLSQFLKVAFRLSIFVTLSLLNTILVLLF